MLVPGAAELRSGAGRGLTCAGSGTAVPGAPGGTGVSDGETFPETSVQFDPSQVQVSFDSPATASPPNTTTRLVAAS